jgi:RNA polymerase sigma-70 factor (ECF subfamily)
MREIDDETLTACQAGDATRFARIVRHYGPPIHAFVWRMLRRSAWAGDAEDVAQEVFVRAYERLGQFRPGGASFSSWLFAIARNQCIDRLRRRGPDRPVDPHTLPEGRIDPCAEDPRAVLERRQEEAAVAEAVAGLEEPFRATLLLFHYDEFSIDEIAEITGTTPGTVKSRLHRARRRLAEILQPTRRHS